MARRERADAKDVAYWNAVANRDRAMDGRVFYAVRTTGVFCRPSCPARRPKRDNVAFFDSAEAAEAAGYRACHRCHPASASGTPAEQRVRRAVAYLDAHPDERITLAHLSREVGLSRFHLQRLFKALVGVSPREYQQARRLERMKGRLRDGQRVGRALWSAGYGSVRGAYEAAANGLGMTPGQYRDGGSGVPIRYAHNVTRFGHLAVAWTPRGVCAVVLGDSQDAVIDLLHDEFRAADVAPGNAAESAAVRAVLDYLEGRHPGLANVPIDVRGTHFQLRVWAALREIPPGERQSYAEIAEAIGMPGAARAVARACAANPAALVVPCHRVVRADGSPGGYRWGDERKRRLLEHEASLAAAGPERPVAAR